MSADHADTGLTAPTAQCQMPDQARPPAGLAARPAVQPLVFCSNWYRRIVSERDVHGEKPFEATDDAPSPVCSGSACHLAQPLGRLDLRTVLSFCTPDAAAAISAARPDAASCQRPQITSIRGLVAVSKPAELFRVHNFFIDSAALARAQQKPGGYAGALRGWSYLWLSICQHEPKALGVQLAAICGALLRVGHRP